MNKFIGTLILSSLCFTSLNAETITFDSLNKNVKELEKTVNKQQDLVSKLSDDIGTMADRIGDMADKIVVTENLLSKTLLALTGNSSLNTTVALLSPLDSSVADKATPPQITLSDGATSYLLYASTDAKFKRENSIVIYIDSTDRLSKSWSQVADLASSNNDVVFIAVKSINNKTISALSNGVKLTLE